MDINLIIWVSGSLIVLFSWFGYVPSRLGWVASVVTTAIMLVNSRGLTQIPFLWLWLTGGIMFVTAWLLNWHRAVSWTGALLTLLAACMSLVANHARQLLGDPVVFIAPSIDMGLIILIQVLIGNYWFSALIRNNPERIALYKRTGNIKKLRKRLERRNDKERFSDRITFLSKAELWKYLELSEAIGTHILLSAIASIVIFTAIAANYYDTGLQFSFVFFSVDWFWAGIIFTHIIGLPLAHLLDTRLEGIT